MGVFAGVCAALGERYRTLCGRLLVGAVCFGPPAVLLMAAALPLVRPSPAAFGETLVLLFWAVIGWEILGNYTLEIESPKRNIPLGAGIAFCAICAVYLAIAAALPRIGAGGGIPSMTDLLTPLFGNFAPPLLAVFGMLLCVCTYLMVVGGVARLAASMAERGELPRMLALRNKEGAPYRSIAALGCVHGAGLLLSSLSALNVASLVGAANGLFLLNSLLAVAAAARLLHSPAVRTASVLLAACFLILFALADRTALLVSVSVLLFSLKEVGQPERAPASG